MSSGVSGRSKICPGCKISKPFEEYHRNSSRRDGRCFHCKDCHLIRSRAYSKAKDRNANRARMLKVNYGITEEEYLHMFVRQGGVCACCGGEETKFSNRAGAIMNLSVDHCHKTGRVRALLCNECNTALGMLHEDPERVECLMKYVLNIKEG